MEDELKIKMYSFTMDCKDPYKLAKFYAELLNWETMVIDKGWACVYAPGTNQGTYPGILFQQNTEYIPPVWPQVPEAQQQMAHIDFAVNDLEKSVQHAIHCGAIIAENQFSDNWRVMFDPSGHPFCLCQMKAIIESAQFGLL
ncbi:MAG: VOC family protein [Lachnotalea sp.]